MHLAPTCCIWLQNLSSFLAPANRRRHFLVQNRRRCPLSLSGFKPSQLAMPAKQGLQPGGGGMARFLPVLTRLTEHMLPRESCSLSLT